MASKQESQQLQGLTALVTGGSSGIGLAVARLFIRQGAQVVLVGRQMAALTAAARSLQCPAEQVHCITGDVSSEGYANKVIFDTRKRFGAVNILVNCAGAFRGGSILKMSEEDFDYMIDVNLKDTWFMCKFAARAMLENDGGAIVNVASTMASQGAKEIVGSAYAAAKGGVISLTNALAVELAPHIRVNCVVPGAVQSSTYELMKHFSVDGVDLVRTAVTVPAAGRTPDIENADSFVFPSDSVPIQHNNLVDPRVATVEDVAEAIVALSDPRSDWVTGEKILIGD